MDSHESEIDYQKQLRGVAGQVESYLVNNAGELEVFREWIKPLAKRWDDYQKAIQRRKKTVSKHWELVKKNPRLQDKEAESPNESWEWDRFYLHGLDSFGSNPINEMPAKYAPEVMAAIEECIERNKKNEQGYPEYSSEYKRLQEGIAEQRQNLADIRSEFDKLNAAEKREAWIKTPPKTVIPNKTYVKFTWWRYINLDDELVFGCWRPKLESVPEDPLERLRPTEKDYYSKPKELLTLPESKDEIEEYERFYIFLSSVHDNCIPEMKRITKDIWPDILAEIVWHYCVNKCFGDKTVFLNIALEKVKRHISGTAGETKNQKPAETGQKATKAKRDSEKWYQSRTIQAALITGGFMLIAAILTTPLWTPFINKLFGGSGNGTIHSTSETNVDSTPAVITSKPNSPVTIDYNSSSPEELQKGKQAIARVELQKTEVNQPQPSSIVKNRDKVIPPEEVAGDVNQFEHGVALLEIFKADSIETIPDLPVIRTYWKRDLSYPGGFLVPDRVSEIGDRSRSAYVARFSFYYEADKSGKYGFTVTAERHPSAARSVFEYSQIPISYMLKIGGVEITHGRMPGAYQGVCNLEKGFHRIEFELLSPV